MGDNATRICQSGEYDTSTKSFIVLADDLVNQRAFKRPLSSSFALPKTNHRKLDMTMNLSNKNAERCTLTRAAEESDIRNLVSFAAAFIQ